MTSCVPVYLLALNDNLEMLMPLLLCKYLPNQFDFSLDKKKFDIITIVNTSCAYQYVLFYNHDRIMQKSFKYTVVVSILFAFVVIKT